MRLMLQRTGTFIESKHKYGEHRHQYLLFFKPLHSDLKKNHVIVYIHGGGWQFGNPEMFRANAQTFVNEGYSVFILTHRRLPFYDCRSMRADLAKGIELIVKLKSDKGLENTGIILGGMSSGGNLAALTFFDDSILKTINLEPAIISGLFLLGAPLNLRKMWQSLPLRMLAGPVNGPKYQLADPAQHIKTHLDKPILIIHGEKDGLVDFASVELFYTELSSSYSGPIEFKVLSNGIHTDSASLGFAGHPSQKIILAWLRKVEAGRIEMVL